MRKSIIYVFVSGVIFGILSYFLAQHYVENQDKIELEKQNLISSLEGFISKIHFYDGEGLTMDEADMVYYNYVNTEVSDVLMFSAREFYAENEKDQKVLDGIIKTLSVSKKLKGITFSNETKSTEMKIHKALHEWDDDNSFLKIKLNLEKKLKHSRISPEETKQLRYIYELEGNYESAQKLRENICKKTKKTCVQEDILIKGTVKDSKGRPLNKVTISVLNLLNQARAITNEDGYFEMDIKTDPLTKIRLRAMKLGYSDGFNDFYIYRPEGNEYEEKRIKKEVNFTLNQSQAVVILNLDDNSIELNKKGIVKSVNFKDNKFHIRTKDNIYRISKDVFINTKEKPFLKGKVAVHLYEFDRDSSYAMENLILADISTEEGRRMFLGGFLTTFGMPYMQFFSERGEELFVPKVKPIYMTYQMVEMEHLREKYNNDRPITEEDLTKLVELSQKSEEYPLSREYLTTLPFDFPPWWMLNRKKGIWENVPFKMMNTTGLLEAIFYSYD